MRCCCNQIVCAATLAQWFKQGKTPCMLCRACMVQRARATRVARAAASAAAVARAAAKFAQKVAFLATVAVARKTPGAPVKRKRARRSVINASCSKKLKYSAE